MDFREDQLALEAYVREACNWRDEDEITENERIKFALEYIELNPLPGAIVRLPREAIVYQRISGEFESWRRIPGTEIYFRKSNFWNWEKGNFCSGVYISFLNLNHLEFREQNLFIRTCLRLGLIA